MDASRIRAVVFDIDDTLCASAQAFGAAIVAATRRYIPALDPSAYPAVIALWRSDPNGYYRAYTRGECSFDEQRWLRANELHARFGGPVLDAEGYAAWKRVFWGTFEANWRANPDAVACVDRLHETGMRLGALSNAGGDLQRRKLEACGFGETVPLLVSMDTFGVGKPDPRVFLESCRLLGLAPAEVAYVGDEFAIDAQAACAVGMRGFWIDRPETHLETHARPDPGPGADRVVRIESLAELPALVDVPVVR